jgi:hypothetical protein
MTVIDTIMEEMTMTDMQIDWRYSEERMELRQKCYALLLREFGFQLDKNGEPFYSMQSITECAHDWVSQGNVSTSGIIKHYETYYKG